MGVLLHRRVLSLLMTATTTAAAPAGRAEWLSARAALAGQRTGRFAALASAIFIIVLIGLLVVPQFGSTPPAAPLHGVRVDTIALRDLHDAAARALVAADSQYDAALLASELVGGTTEGLSPVQRAQRDSLQRLASSLDAALERTVRAPLPESFRALAAARVMRGHPRVVVLLDSLDALDQRRAALAPSSGAERQYAEQSLRAVATERRAEIARAISELESSATRPIVIDTAGPRILRDSARAKSQATAATLAAARDVNARADSVDSRRRETANRRIPPVATLIAALVLGLIVGFSLNLATEIGRPTISGAREAEQLSSAPVLAVARAQDRAPRIGGIDPFRMLYLGLTATGTRTRTVVVSGDDRAVVATVAGRLALAAAADARATLVVDADADGSSVAAYYDERPEPGFSDALASVRLWREVTRPIGANDGLSIDVIPGGAVRREPLDVEARQAAREEFERFRQEYDFCVVVAPGLTALTGFADLVTEPVTILCAEVGRTTLEALRSAANGLRGAGATFHGMALWDAEIPYLATRSEMMAKSAGSSGYKTINKSASYET
jgi:Mrp family chromosome partitioning ATPase